ncbi:MAG: PQQ-dependent sugar dehydrogenase [Pirellulaceae bacterium]|nr:PQQ-dependent sugar dehydrogenase [Pirellulaceae bacterium]
MQTLRLLLGVLLLGSVTQLAAQSSTTGSGLDRRVPWTTSRMVGSPDPPARYQAEQAFQKRKFDKPVVITSSPAWDRLFVAEQGGKVYSFGNTREGESVDLVVDLKQARPDLQAIYGLTFHPKVEQNGFVFVCYIVGKGNGDGTRVSRFQLASSDPPVLDPTTELQLVTWRSGGHNGGCLKFGPDGYLYISTGDAAAPTPPDGLTVGQDVSSLLSSILRIDINQTDEDKNYCVPADNPFVDLPDARPEIWSYGFRNPWKMSFDRQTGDLWVGDVGWELWEMIYRVQKGGNYGWSIMEGRQSVRPEQEPGPTPILPPTIDHPHSEAGSITGGFVYRGERLNELFGAYIYGDYQSGIIWAARLEGDQITWREELARTALQLVGFGEDTAGELYLLDYQGQIYRLVKNPSEDTSETFPRQLSETGLFASVEQHQPAAGVIPYSVNVEQWADHTSADRWLAVPGDGQITISDEGNWQFPDGSVIAKTVSMDSVRTGSRADPMFQTRRLETQVLHRQADSWHAYTYVWNDAQTDAMLADTDGFSRTLEILDPTTTIGSREQTYRFAGRRECVLCHNPWVEARTTIFGVQSASLLGVRTDQLNRDYVYDGGRANQLDTFAHIGVLDATSRELGKAGRLTDPYDVSGDLDDRARSYLHVNCAHCHQFNAGGVATIVLSHDVSLDEAQLLDARPSQGTFGITDARIIAPADPFGSVLLYRVSKLGGGRMPRLGSHAVDDRGVRLLHDWIKQLPTTTSATPSTAKHSLPVELAAALEQLGEGTSMKDRAAAIQRLTTSTRGALALAYRISAGRLAAPVRQQVVQLTKNHPASEVRDLFERFVPVAERIKRLGDKVDAAELLSLAASAERGREVFFNNTAAACKDCHRVGKVGETLGPDLTQIGKKYPRGHLLQHILEPSKFMEPKYVPYVLETTDGRILTGLVESQTDEAVVLRDAKNKRHHVPRAEVELLVRQQRSLMPDLLLRDMTPQDVADLLAYLSGLE